MKKSILISAAFIATFLVAVSTVKATDCGQYGQYSPCPTSTSILIDKTVGRPTSATTVEMVDNTDYKFQAGNIVTFQLRIKNTSTNTLNNVKVEDFIPSYLDPVEGPGSYDAGTRTITFYIPELKVDEEKLYTVKMQVKSQDQVNAIADDTCGQNGPRNRARVTVNDLSAEDAAQFCVEKTVLGVSQVPSTGPENWAAALVASIASLGIGVALKRKSRYN